MKSALNFINWREMTLPAQFLLAGAVVMTVAMVSVASWVASRIEEAVVQNSANSAALLMESFISPLSQELAEGATLSKPARQALAEIFDGTTLGERVVAYKIWTPNGLVIHASTPEVIGRTFEPSDELNRAASGFVAASFEDLNDLENAPEAALNIPLLEVYAPIREAWTGRIIAVAEFYENAGGLSFELRDARRTSWLIVGSAFLFSGFLLLGIVQAGGRTIREQQKVLRVQLDKTEKISQLNAQLKQRAVAASSRAIAQTERTIRRIGSDLHDGPAQYLSLASLRMEGAFKGVPNENKDAILVRNSLNKALEEIRIISRGLALPDLDQLDVTQLTSRAVEDHRKRTGLDIQLTISGEGTAELDYARKLCVFRFLQETLSNVSRHANTSEAKVSLNMNGELSLHVEDAGTGFEPSEQRNLRDDGGQGIFGLKDRAESIGGRIEIMSHPNAGTRMTLILPGERET